MCVFLCDPRRIVISACERPLCLLSRTAKKISSQHRRLGWHARALGGPLRPQQQPPTCTAYSDGDATEALPPAANNSNKSVPAAETSSVTRTAHRSVHQRRPDQWPLIPKRGGGRRVQTKACLSTASGPPSMRALNKPHTHTHARTHTQHHHQHTHQQQHQQQQQ